MTDMLPLDVPAIREIEGGPYGGATFSPCEHHPDNPPRSDGHCTVCARWLPYRYNLWRCWGDLNGIYVCFNMLNPSTADAAKLDRTLWRCHGFAKGWGYDGFCVRNTAAYRATKPEEMRAQADPYGPDNRRWLAESAVDPEIPALGQVTLNIVGWGAGADPDAVRHAVECIKDPYALEVNKDGSPKHPLYVKGDRTPVRWLPNL